MILILLRIKFTKKNTLHLQGVGEWVEVSFFGCFLAFLNTVKNGFFCLFSPSVKNGVFWLFLPYAKSGDFVGFWAGGYVGREKTALLGWGGWVV